MSAGTNLPPTRIVIHATCPGTKGTPSYVPYPRASEAGMAASTARYFTSPASGGSAHYVEDITAETHCVADAAIAWHAPPNRQSIGIEICGQDDYTRGQWLAVDVWPAVARAAARAAELCARFSIPARRLVAADLRAGRGGICGHVNVSEAFHQSNHTDPGPNFPWDAFMDAVHGGTPPPVVVPPPAVSPVASAAVTVEGTPAMRYVFTVPVDRQDSAFPGDGHVLTDLPFDKVLSTQAQSPVNPATDGRYKAPVANPVDDHNVLRISVVGADPSPPAPAPLWQVPVIVTVAD